MRQKLHKAVFLDRDGTTIVDTEFSADPKNLRLLPGAVEGLRRLQKAGCLLIIVTNQSGVARGLFDERELRAFREHLKRRFRRRGIRIADIYYCPHHEDGQVPQYSVKCDCRKPKPGMILRAAKEHGIDLKQSWMIGDQQRDIEAGIAAGCRTIRVGVAPGEAPGADFEAADLRQAAGIILRASRGERQRPAGRSNEPGKIGRR